MDGQHYEDATVFNPWRFSDMRDEEGEDTKHHFVSTSPEYIVFGHGKHAWYVGFKPDCAEKLSSSNLPICSPGRFFAVNELKAMMVHILLEYDVKFEEGKGCPQNVWFAVSISPDPSVKLLFRKRRS